MVIIVGNEHGDTSELFDRLTVCKQKLYLS